MPSYPKHPPEIEAFRPLVSKYFAPQDVDQALMVMWHESRGRKNAVDPLSGGRGLFQLNESTFRERLTPTQQFYAKRGLRVGDDIHDPETNVAFAAQVLRERGWNAWTSAMRGRPAAAGSYGPETFWNGRGYSGLGGGVTEPSLDPIPPGGFDSQLPGVGLLDLEGIVAPTGGTFENPRAAGLELLELLSKQMAGGRRKRIEELDGEAGLLPESATSPNEQISFRRSPADEEFEPYDSEAFSPTSQGQSHTGGMASVPGLDLTDFGPHGNPQVGDPFFAHPLDSGIEPRGMGLFGEPRSHGDHDGIDLSAPEGTPFRTMAPGTVTFVGESSGLGGNVIRIDHGAGIVSHYYHVQDNGFLVQEGDRVQAGQMIALVGSTGNALGPHIHLELRQDNRPVDPWQYIDNREFSYTPEMLPPRDKEGTKGSGPKATAGRVAKESIPQMRPVPVDRPKAFSDTSSGNDRDEEPRRGGGRVTRS